MHARNRYVVSEPRDLDRLFGELPPDAKAPVARFLSAIADHLNAQGQARERTLEARAEAARHLSKIHALGTTIAARISDGRCFDEVARELERQGIPGATILHYWRRYQKVQAKIERAHRNRAILQRAAKGWTNAELGARFKLSKAQISRIIRKAIEAEAKRDL